jgi:hypothetical protein
MQPGPATAEVAIRLVTTDQPHVEVNGLPSALLDRLTEQTADRAVWQRVFSLYVESESESETQATPGLGEYQVRRGVLIFTPRFALKPGLRYRAVFDPAGLPVKPSPARRRTEVIISLPAPPRAWPAFVEEVFPSSDLLPENQLKFYIHFSAPMSRGDSYRHIVLLDAAGMPVEAPFLELAEELWDDTGQRLTLLLDPGRVKQDLKPHKEVGRAFVERGSYALHITNDWPDARGEKLKNVFIKRFRVTKADVRQPHPNRWKLTVPAAGTRQPLIVAFDEPLDHAMLQRVISVSNPMGSVVEGRITIHRHETEWRFEPAEVWVAGGHRLLIDATLEDLAGNSIARPFEVYLPSGRPTADGQTEIEFQIDEESAESPARARLP